MTTFASDGYLFNRQVSSIGSTARSVRHLLKEGPGFSDEDTATLNAASGALDRLAEEAVFEQERRAALLLVTPIETEKFGQLWRTHRYNIRHDTDRWGGSPHPKWAKGVVIVAWHERSAEHGGYAQATVRYASRKNVEIRKISEVVDLDASASPSSSPSSV